MSSDHGEHRETTRRPVPGPVARVPGGPQKTRQFARKGAADRFLDGLRGDLAHGVYVDPAGGRMLFGEYAEKWRAGQVHRPNTATQAETCLRLHAYPTLGRSSPCIRIALPKRADTEIVPLNVTEVEALVAVVPDRYHALIVSAAGMGMRQGECFGLTGDRVDFLRKQVRVVRQLVAARAGVPEFGPP